MVSRSLYTLNVFGLSVGSNVGWSPASNSGGGSCMSGSPVSWSRCNRCGSERMGERVQGGVLVFHHAVMSESENHTTNI